MAVYEAVVTWIKVYQSLVGQLNGLQILTESDKKYNGAASPNVAQFFVAKNLWYNSAEVAKKRPIRYNLENCFEAAK